MHFYCFTCKPGHHIPFYEKTMGTQKAAKEWLKEQKRVGKVAFFTTDCVPSDFFY